MENRKILSPKEFYLKNYDKCKGIENFEFAFLYAKDYAQSLFPSYEQIEEMYPADQDIDIIGTIMIQTKRDVLKSWRDKILKEIG